MRISEKGSMVKATFPQTHYFVAGVRLHATDARHIVCTGLFLVSGNDPLTRDEVVARFRKEQSENWDASRIGPESSWILQDSIVVRKLVQTQGDDR